MKVNCPQWSDCGVDRGGCCAEGRYGGQPSLGVCLRFCPIGPREPAAEIAAGYDPETSPDSPKVGGCCDPPKPDPSPE
jgi:hypothetical protein